LPPESCGKTPVGVAVFRIESDRLDGRPVARVTAPAVRSAATCVEVDAVTLREDVPLAAIVAFAGRDEADAAVLVVVMCCDA